MSCPVLVSGAERSLFITTIFVFNLLFDEAQAALHEVMECVQMCLRRQELIVKFHRLCICCSLQRPLGRASGSGLWFCFIALATTRN